MSGEKQIEMRTKGLHYDIGWHAEIRIMLCLGNMNQEDDNVNTQMIVETTP
jgi:hypothetical protein